MFLLEKWWKQSTGSHGQKEKEKETDGIGWSICGGHCKLALRGIYIYIYIYKERGKEKRRQGGMFLEREDEGGEYELGWKLKIKMSI